MAQRTKRFLSHPFTNFMEFVRHNVLIFLIQDIGELYAKDVELQSEIDEINTTINNPPKVTILTYIGL